MKRNVILLGVGCILVLAFLAAPVTGIAVVEGAKIISVDGATSPMIIIESGLAQGSNITIDITGLNTFVASGTFTPDNVVIDDNAVAAGWTFNVAANNLTLTSAGRAIDPGESVVVTLTGAGNPWNAYTAGEQTVVLTAAIASPFETSNPFNFMIQTGGLAVTDDAKITTAVGETSPVITITNTSIASDDTITIDISNLNWYVVASGSLTNADIVINDTAVSCRLDRRG